MPTKKPEDSQKQSKTPDSTPGAPKKPRGVRLKTIGQCRAFGSKIINKLYREEISEGTARVFFYALSVMNSLITQSDLETRLEEVEAMVKKNEVRR